MNEEPYISQTRKAQIRRILTDIRLILWVQWDPIGVNDVAEAFGEYDSYAPGIYSLLLKGATDTQLAEYLQCIEIERMGLTRGTSQQSLTSVLTALRSIDLQSL